MKNIKTQYNKLRTLTTQLHYIPKTMRLVWAASGKWTVVWIILLIVQGVLPAVTVYLTKLLVDNLVLIIGTGFSWENATPTLIVAGLMATVMVMGQGLGSFSAWVRVIQAELVQDYLSVLVHQKASNLDIAFYESPDYYDRLEQVNNDLKNRPLALLESSGSVAQSAITLLAMVSLLIPYGIWLPFALLVSTLPAFYIVLHFNRRYHDWWKHTTFRRRWVAYYNQILINDTIAPEVRLFNLGPHFASAYQDLRQQLRSERATLVRDQGIAQLGASLIGLLFSGLVIAWIVFQAFEGTFTLGDLTLFYQSFNRGQGLLRALLQSLGDIHNNILFLGNLFEFFELEPTIVSPSKPKPAPTSLKDGIHFQNVTFRYPGSDQPVLQKFNFYIPAGRIIAIVGENGVGKTTLTKLLCRFYDPEEGSIELDGCDLRTLAVDDLRRMMTVMFQYPMLYTATVAENIAMGDLSANPGKSEIEIAARAAGAHDLITRLPNGYDMMMTKLFDGGTLLSGGEKQRLSLARAFLRRAQIMILDEPTSQMDSWSEIDWFGRFRELADGRTAIIITHRFTIAKDADIIYVMDEGRVVESGNHNELLALGGLYAQSWLAQVNSGEAAPPTGLQSDTIPKVVKTVGTASNGKHPN